MTVLSSAVIGLGQAGSRFDEENRPVVWSHAGAYLALPDDYKLVAGADPDAANRNLFAARAAAAAVYPDGARLGAECRPDVVSVCTPPDGRADVVDALLRAHQPRALICEKPLALNPGDRRRIIDRCAAAETLLVVNYNRRYDSCYRRAKAAVVDGQIGDLVSVAVSSPNRLWSIGSHAIDLLVYFAGDVIEDWTALPLGHLYEDGEPAADVLCRFSNGVAGRLATTGRRAELIFEVDLIGAEGRIRIEDNGARATLRRFEESDAYAGYRVLGAPSKVAGPPADESTFVNLVKETYAAVVDGAAVASSGESAAASEDLLDSVAALCREHCAA